MALIKPRSRGKRLVRHRTRLDHETNETLYAYALFIGESTEYVLNQVIDTVLARDKEFLQWRADHPESCIPTTGGSELRRRRGPAPSSVSSASHGSQRQAALGSADAR